MSTGTVYDDVVAVARGISPMSRFTFSLATELDDAQLRACMAKNWMDGDIAISFRREPSYFAGCSLQGNQVQVVICRDVESQQIVGLGSRCRSMMHINGKPVNAGYLADLRIDPAYRHGLLLAQGYRYLRSLHNAYPLPAYFTIIFNGNKPALQSLVGGRAGLPTYYPMGQILTPAIHLDFVKSTIALPGIQLRRAKQSDLKLMVKFMNECFVLRQFSPVYCEQDFLSGGRCAGLLVEDFFLALKDGCIVGTLAAWDQSNVRQTHIERYSPALAALRPIYNLASAISSLKSLPTIGSRIPYLNICCIAIEHDDIETFRALLRFAYNELRSGPWHYAIASLHELDPLVSVLDEYRSISAAGLLYRVEFDKNDTSKDSITLDNRIPYFEMALA